MALDSGITLAIEAVKADGVALVGLVAAAGAAVYLIAKVLARFGFSLGGSSAGSASEFVDHVTTGQFGKSGSTYSQWGRSQYRG
jgi:hypothetical protein